MNITEELKGLMVKIGMKPELVNGINPDHPLAGRVMDSLDYPAFLSAVEERYGVKILDRYALKLRSLNDFQKLVIRRDDTG